MSRRYLPKDGLLRTESSAAHAVTARRRDKIVEELKDKHPYLQVNNGGYIETAGCGIIRVQCLYKEDVGCILYNLHLLGVNELHLSHRPKEKFSHGIIGVVL